MRVTQLRRNAILLAVIAVLTMPAQRPEAQQQRQQQPPLKLTYVDLGNRSNGLLMESPQPSANNRFLVIQTHPDHNNNFNYFLLRELASRGYRALAVNYYGPELEVEEFLPGIGAAVKYARTVPGVDKVLFATHSGGGPVLTLYQEIAEKGPAACQEPSRLSPCRGQNLNNLPKVDGMVLLDPNIGALHRTLSLDPAIDSSNPRKREPALDVYAAQNGYDAETDTAAYSPAFVKRFNAGQHRRSEKLIADAQARLRAIKDGSGPYTDDEPFVVAGMAENSVGARLNLADLRLLSRTHAPHLHVKADGTTPTEIIKSTRKAVTTPMDDRNTLNEVSQNKTVRHFLSFLAIRTTADFEITEDAIKGVDWRSSGNSAVGSVENISVPTLVMAASCAIHLVPLETVFDHSAAKDKEYVAVEGANHGFQPCRPEFGDTRKRAFDYVEAWLHKPGRF